MTTDTSSQPLSLNDKTENFQAKKKWSGRFPNPPDLCFDYRALIEQENGVAKATDPTHKICIIGAGVTGLTAARELYRCGFTDVTLIEQSTALAAGT